MTTILLRHHHYTTHTHTHTHTYNHHTYARFGHPPTHISVPPSSLPHTAQRSVGTMAYIEKRMEGDRGTMKPRDSYRDDRTFKESSERGTHTQETQFRQRQQEQYTTSLRIFFFLTGAEHTSYCAFRCRTTFTAPQRTRKQDKYKYTTKPSSTTMI